MSVDLRRVALLLSLLFAVPSGTLLGQDADSTFIWENSTEFAFVTTSGNATSTTIGLTGTLEGSSPASKFKFEGSGIRASSKFVDRTATGTGQEDFVLNETVREEKSAERYFARARFDRDLGENAFFAFGGAGWERNTFAGFNNRVSLVAGLGDAIIENDRTLLKADVGATYTIQKDVEPTPGKDEAFGGLRSNIEVTRELTASTNFETLLVLDQNLAETEDRRVDWTASVSVSLVDGLALKTSYQLLFTNLPALIRVPLFDSSGNPLDQNVRIRNKKTDTFLTLSLVLSF